ncbi:MAG TPA: class I SAM-dependent methyltransferase [Ktedonobacterales bacterium]|nr:class I SAM-dependent methyltransferase [Ktedonobacterales bacterium]
MAEQRYLTDEHMRKNPDWHVEESAWKASYILRMLQRHHLEPQTICEVGCGAGEVLKQLQEQMDPQRQFVGYDISPYAIQLAQSRANERLRFIQADFLQEEAASFDLILVLDVLEHLEDYFSFLRAIGSKSSYTIFHIPLDLSVQTIMRRGALPSVRDTYGHLHYFTKETALRTLSETGYDILDCWYTARALDMPSKELARNLMRLPRKLLYTINHDLAAHLVGGWSVLILAKGQTYRSSSAATSSRSVSTSAESAASAGA